MNVFIYTVIVVCCLNIVIYYLPEKAVKCNVNKGVVSYYDLFIYSVLIIL